MKILKETKRNPRLSGAVTVALAAFLLSLLAALALGGCAHSPPPAPEGQSCRDVCSRAETMGCAWAAPTSGGASCAIVCENASAARVPWKLECLSRIQSCDEECP